MATLTIKNVEIRDDGNYEFTLETSPGHDYRIILTPVQCADIATIQSTINSIAQPKKFVGQTITVTLT